MCSSGLVKSFTDLFELSHSDLVQDAGFGKRQAEIILEALETAKEIPLDKFLACLGIKSLGRTIGKLLAKEYKTLDTVLSIDESELVLHEGIGDIIASDIRYGLDGMEDTINELRNKITVLEVEEIMGGLSGKSFCLTGKMSKPRKQLEKMIEDVGGETKSVSKGLTYLVQADPTSTSSKSKKALSLGVEIISEETLVEMIG